jgi:hypothetical protein
MIVSIISGLLGLGNSISAYLNKKQDVALETHKDDNRTDVSVIEARAPVAIAGMSDKVNQWGRRLIIYPTGVWYSCIIFRSIFQENSIVGPYTWVIKALPSNLDYIPYAVVAYLLVTAWRK